MEEKVNYTAPDFDLDSADMETPLQEVKVNKVDPERPKRSRKIEEPSDLSLIHI